jgi:hypothetical protein
MPPLCKYRFVNFGTQFQSVAGDRSEANSNPSALYANEVATDVGSRCWVRDGDPLVIDHHFSGPGRFPSASAGVMHLAPMLWDTFHDRDGELWLVTHRQPDFDALCSQYLVMSIVTQAKRPQSVTEADWLRPDLRGVDEELRWQVKLASYASLVDRCARIPCRKNRALHSVLYAAIYRGRNYTDESRAAVDFFDAVKNELEHSDLNPALDSVLEDNDAFAPEMALLDQEVDAYARDIRRGRKTTTYVPTEKTSTSFQQRYGQVVEQPLMESAKEGGLKLNPEQLDRWSNTREPVDGIYVRDPECLLFKEWARMDTDNSPQRAGFIFTGVAYDGERQGAKVNGSNYYFSLDPERAIVHGMHLYQVWAKLQAAEIKALQSHQDGQPQGLEPRREFENRARGMEPLWSDPWFDGSNFACTLIATPNAGTQIAPPGKLATMEDDPIAEIVRNELEYSVFSSAMHVSIFETRPGATETDRSISTPIKELEIPIDALQTRETAPGRYGEIGEGRVQFARVSLHGDVDTGLSAAGREIGESLWGVLHPGRSVPPDFDKSHLIVEPDAISVWSLAGVAVACKPDDDNSSGQTSRAHNLEKLFGRIAALKHSAGSLLLRHQAGSKQNSKTIDAEEDLLQSEQRLADFGGIQYELTFRENVVLREFFDAIRLEDILETVRNRYATQAEKKRSHELQENTETTAEVQSKVEWLEVLFMSFYSVEFANVLLEHWGDGFAVPVIAFIGIAFLWGTYVALAPYKKYKSKSLLGILIALSLVMGASAALSLMRPGWFPKH